MKNVLVIILLATCILSCKKYNDSSSDIDGTLYLRGRALVSDNLSTDGSFLSPFANKTILIGKPEDPSNYLYSTTTDADGYFLFKNLSKKNYLLSGINNVANVIYSTKTLIPLSNSVDTVAIFRPDEDRQNGMSCTVVDNHNVVVSNCNVCVFTNRDIAANNICTGSVYNLIPTNVYGKTFLLNVPALTYYLVFKWTVGTTTLQAYDSIEVGSRGIARKKIILH